MDTKSVLIKYEVNFPAIGCLHIFLKVLHASLQAFEMLCVLICIRCTTHLLCYRTHLLCYGTHFGVHACLMHFTPLFRGHPKGTLLQNEGTYFNTTLLSGVPNGQFNRFR